MRKLIAALFIFLSLFTYSQTSNRFSDTEEVDQHSSSSNSGPEPKYEQYNDTQAAPAEDDCDGDGIPDIEDDEMDCGTPNPGDPVPVDDYIPLLVLVALGMIVYNTLRKKTLS